MTRESKLALIIGFVFVLVVGVLVSDHFSQANSMSLDPQASNDRLSTGPITELGSREKQELNHAITDAIPYAMPEPASRTGGSYQPVIISNGRRASNDQSSIVDRAYNEGKKLLQDAELPEAAQYTLTPPSTTTSQPATRPLPTKRYGTYKVVEGDSLIKIARKMLNDGERWREIHQLNADVLGPDAILKIGLSLKLPSDAKKSSLSSRSSGVKSSQSTYTVQSGDTLGEISMKLLGTSRRADEIAHINGLESKNDIRIGMKLKIPAK